MSVTSVDMSVLSASATTSRPLEADELDRWIDALESDQYLQHSGTLRTTDPDDETGKHGYCCLGLKCEIDGLDLDAPSTVDDAEMGRVLDYLHENSGLGVHVGETPAPLHGLSYTTRNSLANANDSLYFSHSFPMIAAVLREHRDTLLAGGDLHFDLDTGKWEATA